MDWLRSALREWQGILVLWFIATGVGVLAGPFGTFDALSLPGRVVYWGTLTAIAIGLHRVATKAHSSLAARHARGVADIAVELGYAATMATVVWLVNAALFPAWSTPGRWLWLAGLVLAISAAIHAMIWLVRGRVPAPDGREAKMTDDRRFLSRLPATARGPLVRIEAQDHYLLVVTTRGRATILMRMTDAEAELPDGAGLRVHRSHWVSRSAVTGRRRDGDRLFLLVSDGTEIPVSRSARARVREAGLDRG